LSVRAVTLAELRRLWPLFDPGRIGSFDDFAEAAAPVVQARHAQSATIAADYFTRFREMEGVAGSARPVLVSKLDQRHIVEALRSSGYFWTLRAVGAGQAAHTALQSGFVRAAGSAGRLALLGGSHTVVRSAGHDRQALGWQRVTGAKPCAFCAMIASRGAVFSENTASFQAHDHCACTAEPAYRGTHLPPDSERFAELWPESTEGLTGNDALNAFRRALA
jgi:hypothetical protein